MVLLILVIILLIFTIFWKVTYIINDGTQMLHGSISTWSHDQIIPQLIRHEDHINVELCCTNGNFSNHTVIVITNVIFGNKCTRSIPN